MATRRKTLYTTIRLEHFTPLEARELSKLPKNTPALKLVRRERIERRARFEKIAAHKIETGAWKRGQVAKKWQNNLSRMYKKRGWRVKEGAQGKQQPMPKGSPNPWALYRDAERRRGGPGGKKYTSPWEIRQIAQGHGSLDKGLIFIQRTERQARAGTANPAMIREWIAQKDAAISRASTADKVRLITERNRLERLIS